MKTEELPQLPDLRELVHELAVAHRTTGLSPPKEELLSVLEAEELSET